MIKQILIRLNPFIALFPYEKHGNDISFKDGRNDKIDEINRLEAF